jgi:hypothetical protein
MEYFEVPVRLLPGGTSKMVEISFKIAYQKTELELGTSLKGPALDHDLWPITLTFLSN